MYETVFLHELIQEVFSLHLPKFINSVYRGQAAALLRELARSKSFLKATNKRVNPDRMLDCEFVNRFLAFYLLDLDEYNENLEEFLNKVLLKIKKEAPDSLDQYRQDFYGAMETAFSLFGKFAFRKLNKNNRFGKINKPLFECVSVCLAKLTASERECLIRNKDIFVEKYKLLLQTPDFVDVITNATAKKNSILKRNSELNRIISEVLNQK